MQRNFATNNHYWLHFVLRNCLHYTHFNRTLVFGLQYRNQTVYLSMVFRGVGLGKYYILIMAP